MTKNKTTKTTGQTVFYARVSTGGQSLANQKSLAKEHGADKVFAEKKTGANADRPQLQAMLNHIREGDVVLVSKLDRLARSLGDLLHIVKQITDAGAQLKVLDGAIDTTTAQGKLMLSMVGAFAEFERSLINERTAEGRARAKAKGVKFGRPSVINDEMVAKAHQYMNSSPWLSVRSLAKHLGVSKGTATKIMKTPRPARTWEKEASTN